MQSISGMLRGINGTRWFGMDDQGRFRQDRRCWRVIEWNLRSENSRVGEEILSSCKSGCLFPLCYAFRGKVRNLRSSSSSWYCWRIRRIDGQKARGSHALPSSPRDGSLSVLSNESIVSNWNDVPIRAVGRFEVWHIDGMYKGVRSLMT